MLFYTHTAKFFFCEENSFSGNDILNLSPHKNVQGIIVCRKINITTERNGGGETQSETENKNFLNSRLKMFKLIFMDVTEPGCNIIGMCTMIIPMGMGTFPFSLKKKFTQNRKLTAKGNNNI